MIQIIVVVCTLRAESLPVSGALVRYEVIFIELFSIIDLFHYHQRIKDSP